MPLLTDALWEQREMLHDVAPRLKQLREAVNSPINQPLPGWTQLYALARHFKPDLIVELGRGDGNSTAAFTEAANALGNCRVVSVDLVDRWQTNTVPRLNGIVDPDWYRPLTALTGDIRQVDFAPYITPAKRVLLLWDAHGFTLAYFILGHILPLLQGKEHVVLVHDINDTRYDPQDRAYRRSFDGMPTYWVDYLVSPFSEILPFYDFVSRNQIPYHTAEHDFHALKADPARWSELERLWTDAYGADNSPASQGYFAYFTLSERANPEAPLCFPDPDFGGHLASEVLGDRRMLLTAEGVRPEEIYRIRELARGILVRLKWALRL